MRTDETLRLRLAEVLARYGLPDHLEPDAPAVRLGCAETRANVESARAQVAEERLRGTCRNGE